MIERIFQFTTHFGDSALLMPLSIAAIALLVWSGHRPAALRFAIAVACLIAATLAAKIVFYAIGGDQTLDVLSPSGHAGFSVTVYGCGAVVLAKQFRPAAAVFVAIVVAALLASVLVSRVVLGAHTPSEVVIGTALGLLCIAVFVLWNPDLARLRLRPPASLVLALMIGSFSFWAETHQYDAESRIEHVGVMVGLTLGTLLPGDVEPRSLNKVRR